MAVRNIVLLLAGIFLLSIFSYRLGKHDSDAYWQGKGRWLIGWAEPRVGTCKAFGVSDKQPGEVTPIWYSCDSPLIKDETKKENR